MGFSRLPISARLNLSLLATTRMPKPPPLGRDKTWEFPSLPDSVSSTRPCELLAVYRRSPIVWLIRSGFFARVLQYFLEAGMPTSVSRFCSLDYCRKVFSLRKPSSLSSLIDALSGELHLSLTTSRCVWAVHQPRPTPLRAGLPSNPFSRIQLIPNTLEVTRSTLAPS